MTKVFLVYGHYDDKSFNAAIKNTFIETAKGQDMIYGGNSRTLAIYQAIEDVRKANNDKCDEIDALSGAPAIEAYNPEY